MTQRLPIPGSDDETWGDLLNGFLEVSHNADGTLISSAVSTAGAELSTNKAQANGYASLNSSGLVPTSQLATGSASSANYLRGDGTWVTPNSGSSSLASDTDVAVVSPTANQVLTYNSVASKWENIAAVNSVTVNSGSAQTGAVAVSAVQVAGDIGGTTASPTVTTSNSIPIVTTTGTQTLTNKSISGSQITSAVATATTASTVTTNANLTGDVTSTGNATTLTSSSNVESIISANTTVAGKANTASPTFAGKVTTPALQVTTGSGTANQVLTSDTNGNATWSTPASGAQALVPTAVKTSAYTAAAGDFIPVDVSGGFVTVTLPTAPADKARVEIKMINTASSNTVTFNTGGSDVINKAGGVTTGTLSLLNQAIMLQYASSTGIWYVQSDDLPLTQLDARYPQSGAYVAPTSTAGAPTTGSWTTHQAIVDSTGTVWTCTAGGTPGTWVEGASSITYGTTAGTAAQGNDSRFGVASVLDGVTVTGTPSIGQLITATSTSAASWQLPSTTSSVAGGSAATRNLTIAPRSGTASAWASAQSSAGSTAVLSAGELGYVTDTDTFRVGDGTTLFGSLPVIGGPATSISGIAVSGTPSTGQVLTATSTSAADWATPSGGSSNVIDGVTVSGTPSIGQLITATSTSAASWQSPSAGSVTGEATPGHFGFIGWSVDPAIMTTAFAWVSGVVYLARVTANASTTVGHIAYRIATAGSGLTAGESFVGLYDFGEMTAGTATRIAVSADQSTTWTTQNVYSTAMTSPATVAVGSDYLIAWVSTGTTPPAISTSGGSYLANIALTFSTYRFATYGTGQTTLPTSFTLTSMVNFNSSFIGMILA